MFLSHPALRRNSTVYELPFVRVGFVALGGILMINMPWLPIGGWFNGSRVIFSLKSGVAGLQMRPFGTAFSASRLRALRPTVAEPCVPLNWIGNWNVVVAKLITSQPSPYSISGPAEYE